VDGDEVDGEVDEEEEEEEEEDDPSVELAAGFESVPPFFAAGVAGFPLFA